MVRVRQNLPQTQPHTNLVTPDVATRAASLDDARVGDVADRMAGDVDDATARKRQGVRHRAATIAAAGVEGMTLP